MSIKDARPEKHRELIQAIVRFASARGSTKKLLVTQDELVRETGLAAELWPGRTMDLLPLLTFFFGRDDAEIDPVFCAEFSARAAPTEQVRDLTSSALCHVIARSLAERIESNQEFTIEGIAAETGVAQHHVRAEIDRLSHGAGLTRLANGTHQWDGRASLDYLRTVLDPLAAEGPAPSPRTALARDPTGCLIAQQHLAALVDEHRSGTSSETPLALLRVDLDKFKPVNDNHGHLTGDAVLRSVYGAIAGVVAGHGHAIRAGGDEVVVLLPNFDAAQAMATAARLRAAVEMATIEHAGQRIGVTASIGVAIAPPTALDQVEDTADKRQYQAKHNGGNCVVGPDDGQ